MDIDKIWKELKSSSLDHDQIDKEMILQSIHQESHSAIAALKKQLKSKINYVIGLICLFCMASIYFFNNAQMVLLISIVNAVYIFAYFLLQNEYKKMKAFDNKSMPLLQQMRGQLKLIKNALNVENISFLCTLPLVLLPAILYHDVANGFTILEAFNAGDNIRKFAVWITLATPFVYLSGAWMNKISFGKDIKRLESSIAELESIN